MLIVQFDLPDHHILLGSDVWACCPDIPGQPLLHRVRLSLTYCPAALV
jgi:hypothetical protein